MEVLLLNFSALPHQTSSDFDLQTVIWLLFFSLEGFTLNFKVFYLLVSRALWGNSEKCFEFVQLDCHIGHVRFVYAGVVFSIYPRLFFE